MLTAHAISCVHPFPLLKSFSKCRNFQRDDKPNLWENYKRNTLSHFCFLYGKRDKRKGEKMENTNSLILECSMSCIPEGMVYRHVQMSRPDQQACLRSWSRDGQTSHKSVVLPAFNIISKACLPISPIHLDMPYCSHFQPYLKKYTIFQIQKEFILVIQNLAVCKEANCIF